MILGWLSTLLARAAFDEMVGLVIFLTGVGAGAGVAGLTGGLEPGNEPHEVESAAAASMVSDLMMMFMNGRVRYGEK